MKSHFFSLILVMSAILFLAACAEPFTIEGIVGGNIDPAVVGTSAKEPLTIVPASVALYVDQTLEFGAYGGTGPYSFAVTVPNSSPPAMAGAVYTAGGNSGVDTVTVTDSLGESVDAQVTVSTLPLSTAVDYDISLPSFSITSASPYLAGTVVNGQFDITNQGGNAGGFPINYSLFASANSILGPQDYLVASGSTPQLSALQTATVNFSGNWPMAAGNYYLILEIEALDDNSATNNSWKTGGADYTVQ